MSKSKVSKKETPKQEPIKHFNYGVVSWGLFRELWEAQNEYIKKLSFILENTDFDDWGLNIAFDLIEMAEKDADEWWEKALIETNEAGGNDIYTISKNETLELKAKGGGAS